MAVLAVNTGNITVKNFNYLLQRFLEGLASNLGYPDRDFYGFSQSFQDKCQDSTSIRRRSLTSKSFPIHPSYIILQFGAIWETLQTCGFFRQLPCLILMNGLDTKEAVMWKAFA
jgi:hypothetical protein